MTPEALLRTFCARHGIPPERGARLLPLVERALQSPADVRERLLALVEANLAQSAKLEPTEQDMDGKVDRDVLSAVARVLHEWSPSRLMLDLGDQHGRPASEEA